MSFQFSLGDSYVILSGHSPFGAGQVRWDDVPADFPPTQDTPG